MERLACVDLPALPLQLLVQRHASWEREAVAVVERDAPHGVLIWVNERARREGVLPGLRYSAALSLCPQLRAAEVAAREIEEGVEEVVELLRRFSPEVEPSRDEPGVFWVDLSGLELLHPSLVEWTQEVRAAAARAGWECAVVAGARRFSTYAVAKALHGARVIVFARVEDEEALARRVLLRRIAIEPAVRGDLEKLAIRTVGDLLRLPAESVLLRFGPELHRLHRLASGELHAPLEPRPASVPPNAHVDLDFALTSVDGIAWAVEQLARPLLADLASRGRGVKELRLRLTLEDASAIETGVQPAEATLELTQLVRLLRLRLETVELARGAERVEIELDSAPVGPEQLRLFAAQPGRDLQAAAKAFAALRAAFGDDVVVRARLASAHLPEASFAWERCECLVAPRARRIELPPLVRRIHARPIRLPTRQRHEEDGWMLRGLAHGPVELLHGPYPLSGGWWRAQVERDYYFAQMQSGEVMWIFFDRQRRRWFLQGTAS